MPVPEKEVDEGIHGNLAETGFVLRSSKVLFLWFFSLFRGGKGKLSNI